MNLDHRSYYSCFHGTFPIRHFYFLNIFLSLNVFNSISLFQPRVHVHKLQIYTNEYAHTFTHIHINSFTQAHTSTHKYTITLCRCHSFVQTKIRSLGREGGVKFSGEPGKGFRKEREKTWSKFKQAVEVMLKTEVKTKLKLQIAFIFLAMTLQFMLLIADK